MSESENKKKENSIKIIKWMKSQQSIFKKGASKEVEYDSNKCRLQEKNIFTDKIYKITLHFDLIIKLVKPPWVSQQVKLCVFGESDI